MPNEITKHWDKPTPMGSKVYLCKNSNDNIMSSLAWKNLNWSLINSRLFRYQTRIFKASRENNIPKVKCLQKRLLNSFDAKLVAVRQVTIINKGKRMLGIDKDVFTTDLQKEKLVKRLRLDGKVLPIQPVYIDKFGKTEKRSNGLIKVRDSAKQALCLLALEPEWEARFDANSYGFRPGRFCHDAVESTRLVLRNYSSEKHYHKYILNANITKCFDQINQEYLVAKLNTLPIMERQVKAWLKVGVLEGLLERTDAFENIIGVSRREIISPFLLNIALHGLENHIKKWSRINKLQFVKVNQYSVNVKRHSLAFARYANKFVMIHKDKTIIRKAKAEITRWLWEGPCLKLDEETTFICNSSKSFSFLGFSFITRRVGNKTKVTVYPSRNSQALLLLKVRNIIQNNCSASSYNLISLLRPAIFGWADYFKYSECRKCFHKLAHLIFQKLRAWVFRRDTRNGRKEVKQRYFPSGKEYYYNGVKYKDNWVLNGKIKGKNNTLKENWLPSIAWIKSRKWIKIKGDKSPFDGDNSYWEKRIFNKGN